jgi:hypothetical protein
MPLGVAGAHSWHVLRGFKHSAGRVEHSMRAAMHILQGSFDPIMDAANNTDLLPLIIQAKVWMGVSDGGGDGRGQRRCCKGSTLIMCEHATLPRPCNHQPDLPPRRLSPTHATHRRTASGTFPTC